MKAKLGIAPIAWWNDDLEELSDDVSLEECLRQASAAGFTGMETGRRFPMDAKVLGPILKAHKMSVCGGWFSGLLLDGDMEEEKQRIGQQMALFKAVNAPCIVYGECARTIQGDRSKPLASKPKLSEDEIKVYARKMTKFGEWCAEQGMPLSYHHHMAAVIETEPELDMFMKHSGEGIPLLFDAGHMAFAGGDVMRVIDKHHKRITHVHTKDVRMDVIAGATQGLGAAIARRLAAAGAAGIVVTGRNENRGATVAEGIAATSRVPTLFVRGDLASIEDCRRMIVEADERFGRVNVLVNAGASTERGTILDTTPDLFDRMFAINVRGPFFLMQEAIKLMIRDGVEGAICNIGSISALAGQPFINPYCTSKGALTTLTANTAFSVMRNRIRVNQLNVGWMASDNERVLQAAESGDPDWMEKAASQLPFGRLIDPEEAARAVRSEEHTSELQSRQ